MRKTVYINISIFLCFLLSSTLLSGQSSPKSGELIITEFMANPSSVSDTKGEWLELQNVSTTSLILNNISISDLGSNQHKILSDKDIILEPGQYYVLARSIESIENGGFQPDYQYSNFTLGNTEDEIILKSADDELLDIVSYSAEWSLTSGASCELDPSITDTLLNNHPENWHLATMSYGEGDLGTPGSINSVSTGIFNRSSFSSFQAFPNPCTNELNLRLLRNSSKSAYIQVTNILGQTFPVYQATNQQNVILSYDFACFPKGIYWVEAISENLHEAIRIIKL